MSEVRLKDVQSSLELTDACIIDGDKDTLTIAIKVQREWLRANHHFLLAALACAEAIKYTA